MIDNGKKDVFFVVFFTKRKRYENVIFETKMYENVIQKKGTRMSLRKKYDNVICETKMYDNILRKNVTHDL